MDAAKMIDANRIKELEVVMHASLPPSEAIGGVAFPSIERIAPKLSIGREVVRRHAGHGKRASGFVELEKFGTRLGVAAVSGDVDGFVAEELNAFAVRIFAECVPLLSEKELEYLGLGDEAGGGFGDGPFVRCGEAVDLA